MLGEHEEAARLYPLIEEAFPTGAVLCGYDGRLVHTLAGIAAAAGGRWATAEEHFEKAVAQAEELSHRIERPEVRRFYAQMLIERDAPGDRDRAGELLQESIDAYRAIGMPRHEEMAGALLRDL